MLARNCMILLDEIGSYKLVQDLVAGDLVFDPMADDYVSITQILSKRVDLLDGFELGEHPLCPIEFCVGAISSRGPHKQVRTSPGQAVTLALPTAGEGSVAAVEIRSALALSETRAGVFRHYSQRFVEYFAIFTESSRFLDVGGLLMSTTEDPQRQTRPVVDTAEYLQQVLQRRVG